MRIFIREPSITSISLSNNKPTYLWKWLTMHSHWCIVWHTPPKVILASLCKCSLCSIHRHAYPEDCISSLPEDSLREPTATFIADLSWVISLEMCHTLRLLLQKAILENGYPLTVFVNCTCCVTNKTYFIFVFFHLLHAGLCDIGRTVDSLSLNSSNINNNNKRQFKW